MSEERSEKIRGQIQEQMDKQAEEHKKNMFRRRLELAQDGLRFFESNKIPDAVRAFNSYLKILEDWKKVPEGGLHPSLFNVNEEKSELLLISGVYWDLAKLYDRTKSEKRAENFRHYLEKFVIFSKGMPFQRLCAETMRKYIRSDRPVHKSDFKAAYKRIALDNCFIATAVYEDLSDEDFDFLRIYRDSVLMGSIAGRAFVSVYYSVGPFFANIVACSPRGFRKAIAAAITNLIRFLSSKA